MAKKTYDAVVLGGGPGGYVCAIRLAQLGLKTACVEEDEVGGVCLNWGCVPSKALISTAHLYEKAATASEVGIQVDGIRIDAAVMQDWKNKIVKKLTGGVRTLFKANGVDLIEGRGRLASASIISVQTRSGEAIEVLGTKGVVVASGSETIEIPGFKFDGQRILGAKEAVSLRAVPKRLCVIGGGVIGLELGMVYQKLGSELTVVELTSDLLPGTDRDCVKVVERRLKKLGATVFTKAKAEGFDTKPDGAVAVRVTTEGGPQTIECDVVLVVGSVNSSNSVRLTEIARNVGTPAYLLDDAAGLAQPDDLARRGAIEDVDRAERAGARAPAAGEQRHRPLPEDGLGLVFAVGPGQGV